MYGRADFDMQYAEPPDSSVDKKGPVTFDDISGWDKLIYDGEECLVSDYGELVFEDTPGRHVELWALESPNMYVIHEKWVDLWFRGRRKLLLLMGDN